MFLDFNPNISGPWSYGPGRQPAARPIIARTPAGPVSLPWREMSYAGLQPQLSGLGLTWDPGWFEENGVPTYGTTTYAPYCQSVVPWVLGAALVVLLLTRGNK